ncbi:uncharacterized protein F5147DRAFT_587078, partial [Suillus discolor]
DPRSVDVNVHPTKRKVHFLNQETTMVRMSDVIQQNLAGQSQSRVLYQIHVHAYTHISTIYCHLTDTKVF